MNGSRAITILILEGQSRTGRLHVSAIYVHPQLATHPSFIFLQHLPDGFGQSDCAKKFIGADWLESASMIGVSHGEGIGDDLDAVPNASISTYDIYTCCTRVLDSVVLGK